MIYNPYGKNYIWSFVVYYNIIIIWCTRFETNYNSCTGKSNENICSSDGGAQEKGRTGWNSVYHQNWWFSLSPPFNANVFFCRFFFYLTLCTMKCRVLGLCLSYFTDNSDVWVTFEILCVHMMDVYVP